MIASDWVAAFWRQAYRWKWARARMPYWRVVVDAHCAAAPSQHVMGALHVWAEDAEEAEGLAILAVRADGHDPITADAVRMEPCTRPAHEAGLAWRGAYTVYGGLESGEQDAASQATPPHRRRRRADRSPD